MVCCGAGTAADCDKVTDMIGSQLKLLRLDWNRQVRVKTANHLFKQMLFRYSKSYIMLLKSVQETLKESNAIFPFPESRLFWGKFRDSVLSVPIWVGMRIKSWQHQIYEMAVLWCLFETAVANGKGTLSTRVTYCG